MGEQIKFTEGRIKQLGFHYYSDSDHYDDASLDYWLPRLEAAGTRWIVLPIAPGIEIPEAFLTRLVNAKIEPVIDLGLNLSEPLTLALFRQRMKFYRRLGAHTVQFFRRPNMRCSWSPEDWQNPGLIELFVEKFIIYAQICVEQRIIPIFPMLEPGGDYWDISFLKKSLLLLKEADQENLVSNMLFSANAGCHEHPLDWGKGGPSKYPAVIAYNEENQIDHRGFYIFEWYHEIAQQILEISAPIILFSAGQWKSGAESFDASTKDSKRQYLQIIRMIQGLKVENGSFQSEVPDYVISCNLYKLPSKQLLNCVADNPKKGKVAEKNEKIDAKKADESQDNLDNSFAPSQSNEVNPFAFNPEKEPVRDFFPRFWFNLRNIGGYILTIFSNRESLTEYFLLPEVSDLFTEEQLEVIRRYVKINKCGSGKNLNEALSSSKVTLINDTSLYPAYVIRQLHEKNCLIQTVSLQTQGN